jgi:hypothetical protein
MDIELFNNFAASIKHKDRIAAKKYIDKFIKSFTSYEEKETFTKAYLSELENKEYRHIRHELFVNIVFPVLINDYNNKNIQSMIWIIKFIHEFYNHNSLCKQNDFYIGYEIRHKRKMMLEECYEIAPDNEEVHKMYIEMKIEDINSSIYWMNDRKKDISRYGNRLLEMTDNLKNIDKNKVFDKAITKCENKAREYIETIEKLIEINRIEKL